MKYSIHKKRFANSLMCIILAVITALFQSGPVGVKADTASNQVTPAPEYSSDNLTYYYEVYAGYDLNKEYSSQEINLDINSALKDDGTPAAISELNGKNVILWDNMASGYTFDFNCNEGLYYIEFEYSPLADSAADIIRSVLFDGKSLFAEADNIKLPNEWVSSGENYVDINKDEKAAPLIQKCEFKTVQARDLYGLYSEPLLFELKEGKHSLTLQYIIGSVAISSVKLIPYRPNISYSEYINQQTASEYQGSTIVMQGEASASATERVLSGYCEKDPSMTPYTLGVERINTIGGWNWRNGNEEISWKVNAPEDGLYKLALRVSQNYNGLVTYRQILIDDAVPFSEVSAYPFYAHSGYVTDTIGGESAPYLFALTKGEHTITLRAVTGEMSPLINQLQAISRKVADTVRQIQTITGTNPDPNFDYELAKKMPWLLDDLRAISGDIKTQADYLKKICKRKPPVYSTLTSDIDKINAMIKRPRSIPLKLADLTQVQGDLADNSTNLKYMPLAVDFLEFTKPEEKIAQHKPTFWEKLQLIFVDFIQSFTKDYSNVKNDTPDENGMKTLNVWVSRGREWGETIQRMADEEFTPKYKIRVNVNILPTGSTGIINGTSPLLLSIVSGNTPDIAMGSDMDTPIELAIRGSVADISAFPDYTEITGRFSPAAITPLTYNGKVYALPETMDIPLLIYRTDIFNELGIEVPDTWEELWTYTIPKLKQNNANFSISSNPDMAVNTGKMAMYSTFLFQDGGDFYSADGKSSLLNSDAAFNAFSDWTKNFTQYLSPQSVNFYQQMRTGDIPMGVGFLGDYLMLDIAAPELYGRFNIAPIPGKEAEDGTIIRYGAGSVSSAMIFKNSTKQQESWEFLKWWTDENTQIRFDSEIEAKIGPTGRWFSANLNAFYSLPWGQHRSEVIKDWMPWYRNPVNTLGGYMTPRAINNAWTRTVMSSMKTRDSLEQAFDEISIEMERKQLEYGVKQ